MDHQHIEENNVADRYILGKLSVAERAQFEEHFVDCAECIHSIEVTERFRTGLRIVAAERSMAYAMVGLMGWLVRLSRGRRMALLGIALLVIVLPTGLMISELRRARGELRQAQSALQQVNPIGYIAEQQRRDAVNRQTIESLETALKESQQALAEQKKQLTRKSQAPVTTGFASVFILSNLRARDPSQSASVNQVIISPSSEWLVLSPELDPDPAVQSYRASITMDGRIIWQQDGVALNSKRTLEPVLSASLFKTGSYLLTVEGLTPQGSYSVAAKFPFQVVRK